MSDLDRQEAQRRVNKACDLIRSAYRLHTLDPKQTIESVRTSIAWGVELQAEDAADDARTA